MSDRTDSKSPAARIAEQLGQARCEGMGWRATCPACRNHTAFVADTPDGSPHVRCDRSDCTKLNLFRALYDHGLWPEGHPPPQGITEDALRDALFHVAFAPVAADCWAAPSPRMDWVIEDWLPASRVTMLTGAGGLGKSRLALMLAVGIAAEGTNWLQGGPPLVDPLAAPAVFASWEDDRDLIRRRLNDWPATRMSDAGAQLVTLLGDRLVFRDLGALGPIWAPGAGITNHANSIGGLTDLGRRLRSDVEARRARLLIVDPLAAAYACNENDRSLVRGFMADWDAWARRAGCAVLFVAHPSKTHADYSGSTDWLAAARAFWSLSATELPGAPDNAPPATRLECLKTSYGQKPGPLLLEDWQWWQASPWVEGNPYA